MSNKKKKKKKPGVVFIIIIVACIAIAGFAAYNLISIGLTYKQAEDEYDDLQQYAIAREVSDTDSKDETEEASSASTSSSSVKVRTHEIPIDVDFDSLLAINPDVVGWLYIEVENISYPIVQGDDNDYYLHRTVQGTSNYAGSIFLEYQNSPDFTDPNTIIYGHNMKDQSMFGKLKFLYEFEDYLINNTFWIITPDMAYEYDIFNLEVTTSTSDVYTLFYGQSDLVTEYISKMASQSLVDLTPETYDANSKVVTLSTCVTGSDDERFVAQGICVYQEAINE